MKGDGAIVANTERVISNGGNFIGEKSKVEGVTASFNTKKIGGPEAVKCSWISKSFYQRTRTSEDTLQPNQASNLPVSAVGRDKPNGIECAAGKNSVQLFSKSKQTSNFPTSNYNQKKSDGESSRSKGRKDETTERVEEFAFTTVQDVSESDKTKLEDKINRTGNGTENLRMKLCQILGTTASPETQHAGSQTRNMGEESLRLEQRLNMKDNKFVKTRQNSDSIETDSENPDHTRKRPVTRSLTRKKASSKKQPAKVKSGPSSKDTENRREKDIFFFGEKWTERRDTFPNDGSSMSLKKKGQGKNSKIGPDETCFTENDAAEKLCQDTSKTNLPLHDGATFSLGNKMGGFIGFLSDQQTKSPLTQKINQKKEFYQPPAVTNTDQDEELEVSENGNQQEHRSDPVVRNVAKSQDNFQSPTFQLNTPALSSSPSSTPKTDQKANDISSPASTERSFSLGTIRNLRTFQTLEPDFSWPREPKQSSVSLSMRVSVDNFVSSFLELGILCFCLLLFLIRLQDMEELKHSIPRKDTSFMKETAEQDGSSDSSSEERNFPGSQEGLRFIKEDYIHSLVDY